ncbi:MAG: o-succinylbenzoate synthase [Bacteroidetes bacterium B1(2017)]|nr:MAG: o-succinylbenzoate synthase [Bacteroidetes bacterium B1(2017)]
MNELQYGYIKRNLEFSFQAKTSRGEIKTHAAYLVYAFHPSNPTLKGWGEASPLMGLSIDGTDNFEEQLSTILAYFNEGNSPLSVDLTSFPAVRFAIETAQLDLFNGGEQIVFDNTFIYGKSIPINGLVWMDSIDNMLVQAVTKIQEGYTCIKFKIGAHDFDVECKMLEQIRKQYPADRVEIRLDANGAFAPDDAVLKLKELARFGIHSIEQPIAPRQLDEMEEVCGKSPIPVALDEELIGLDPEEHGAKLLKFIKPKYLILKPTLLGGLGMSAKWVRKANEHEMDWWATSALESNIGLNAIAQWTAVQKTSLPQGLGTGNLYTNNIEGPLLAKAGALHFLPQNAWKLPHPELD